MNVCIVCQGDGVLNALGHWYCIQHLEEGFLNVAEFVARARGMNIEDYLRITLRAAP